MKEMYAILKEPTGGDYYDYEFQPSDVLGYIVATPEEANEFELQNDDAFEDAIVRLVPIKEVSLDTKFHG